MQGTPPVRRTPSIRAIALAPDDLHLYDLRVTLAMQAGDLAKASEGLSEMASRVGGGAHGAALELRIADLAARAKDEPTRRRALDAARRHAPASPAVAAAFHEEAARRKPARRVEALLGRARELSGKDSDAPLVGGGDRGAGRGPGPRAGP